MSYLSKRYIPEVAKEYSAEIAEAEKRGLTDYECDSWIDPMCFIGKHISYSAECTISSALMERDDIDTVGIDETSDPRGYYTKRGWLRIFKNILKESVERGFLNDEEAEIGTVYVPSSDK